MYLFAFALGLLIGVLLGVLFILWRAVPHLERLYVFRPSRDIFKTPEHLGLEYEQRFLETPDGCRLSGWLLCPPNPLGSVIYFHGNGGNLGILNEIFALLYRHGLQVWAIDYRGYGWSTGTPSEKGLYVDAEAAVEYFRAQFHRPELPLVYWGRSLGSCVAAYAASRSAPDGLVLESAFPDKKALLENFPHLRPFRHFARYRFETRMHLNGHRFPVLLLHGDQDRTIPIELGEKLFEGLSGPKDFHRVNGAGHVDLHMIDTGAYMRRVIQFIQNSKPNQVH